MFEHLQKTETTDKFLSLWHFIWILLPFTAITVKIVARNLRHETIGKLNVTKTYRLIFEK